MAADLEKLKYKSMSIEQKLDLIHSLLTELPKRGELEEALGPLKDKLNALQLNVERLESAVSKLR